MKWWLIVGLVLGSMFPVSASPCDLHPLPSDRDTATKEEPVGTSGLTAFYFDLDGDEVADRALIYQKDRDGHFFHYPLMYMEGLDAAENAQEVWIDRELTGNCRDIILYWKRRM